MNWKTWRLEYEWTPSKLQHYWERPEYREKSWRFEITCVHPKSSGRSLAAVGVKKLLKEFDNNNNNNNNNNNFDIHTDHLITARRPVRIIINKKREYAKMSTLLVWNTRKNMEFGVSADHRIKLKECEKRISTSTLLENWKNYGTGKWQLYQL